MTVVVTVVAVVAAVAVVAINHIFASIGSKSNREFAVNLELSILELNN